MTNFNPAEHDNAVNPYTLSKERQEEIINTVADDRLVNPPGDYFRLELEGEIFDIPKLEYIGIKTEPGKISRVHVTEYIRKQLNQT